MLRMLTIAISSVFLTLVLTEALVEMKVCYLLYVHCEMCHLSMHVSVICTHYSHSPRLVGLVDIEPLSHQSASFSLLFGKNRLTNYCKLTAKLL